MWSAAKALFRLTFRTAAKVKLKYACLGIGILALLDFLGAFTHYFEATYNESFSYPYNGEIYSFVAALRHGQKPDVPPINGYNYTFLHTPKKTCNDQEYQALRLVYLVKSAMENFDRRTAIRNSWGFEKRFFDVSTRTVFLLGVRPGDEELQKKVHAEVQRYQDIVQADFVDEYFNNTHKTMTGFRWAAEQCSKSKFYMFVDDDMYVSVKNVLRFVRNPPNYPDYLKEAKRFGGRKREIRIEDMPEDLQSYERSSRIVEKEKKNPGWNLQNETKFDVEKEPKVSNESEMKSVKDDLLGKNLDEKDSPKKNDRIDSSTENYHRVEPLGNDLHANDSSPKNFHRINSSIQSLNSSTQNLNPIDSLDENHPQVDSSAKNLHWNNSVEKIIHRRRRQVFDFELPDDVRLYAGFVFVSSPHRHKTSKWYVSLDEYPYHLWPPYVTAGAYIVSREALLDMYYSSFYTKHFRFDDIFLGLVAKKADIEPFHCEEFHFYKKDYNKYNYKYVITSHGYGNPEELMEIWNEQKALGNA